MENSEKKIDEEKLSDTNNKVENTDKTYIGDVTAVYDFGAGPLIEIGEELVIFNNDNFPLVNIKEKKIIRNSKSFGDKND